MAVAIPAKRTWADVATVTLLVGETKTVFHVHEKDLFEASPFFKAAFTSKFRESSERTMTLTEDDESIFELFVDWLYHKRYDVPSTPNDPKTDYDRFMQPVQLFVLADKYDVRNLKSLIVSQIFIIMKQDSDVPNGTTIAYAYEHTSQNSTIRKILADHLACETTLEWFKSATSQTWLRNHPDVSADVIVSFAKHTLRQKTPFGGEMPEDYVEKKQESEK